jgi:orotate phosphoribosyltransferase
MKKEKILKLFEEKKALLKGHFLLSSGLHSDTYLQSALVLQYPDLAGKLARLIVHKLTRSKIDTVVSPALGGIVIGQEVARVLGCRAIFTEREEGKMTLRRGFQIKKEEKVLVVEDVITTGGSTQEVINVVKNAGGKIVAVGCLVDRSGGQVKFDYSLISLLKLKIKNYQSQRCLLCKKNIPLVKPGSRIAAKNAELSQRTQKI